jgi:uncharacterized OB-fold protein
MPLGFFKGSKMKAEIAECTVVETKFEPLQKAHLIVVELGKGAYLNMLCPFEHKLKVGDKVKLFAEIPLELARVRI